MVVTFSKGAAFKESWNDLYKDRIDYRGNTQLIDINPDEKKP